MTGPYAQSQLGETGAYGETDLTVALLGFACSPGSQAVRKTRLEWTSREEVGRLQWHMLRCTLAPETKVRRDWHLAVRNTLERSTDNARVINAAMACWSTSDRGVIHTALEDESAGWQAPTTRLVGNDGKWEFVDGNHPTFDRREHWGDDSDDDGVTDLTDVTTDATAETDAAVATKVRTATGDAEYNADWNGIDSSDDPTLTTLRLLHSARQMVDTSRWWTLRWPNSAISLLGTACGLSTPHNHGIPPDLAGIPGHTPALRPDTLDRLGSLAVLLYCHPSLHY